MIDVNKNIFGLNQNTGSVEEDFGGLDIGKEAATSFYWKMTYPSTVSFVEPAKDNNTDISKMVNGLASAGGFGPAPALMPINKSNPTTGGDKLTKAQSTPSVHVNIRDTHHWTESPISARREVPMLSLKENKIMTNVALNQMLNMVGNAAGAAGEGAKSINNLFSKLRESSLDETSGDNKNKDPKEEKLSEEDVRGGIGGAINPEPTPNIVYSDPMNPYSLLYTTHPTGFKYSLPYMENTYVQNTGGFGDSGSGGTVSNILMNLGETATNFLQELNLNKTVAPGRMIEKPKGFTFDGREKSYTVSFPLFNTKSYSELIKNWQFLFLLAYQNSPNRINRDLIDPPCIYEASISGVWYSRYAALTNLTVDFVGARREMMLPVQVIDHLPGTNQQDPTNNWKTQKRKTIAVIPDAYQVTMTFTELFAESQNFKFQMLRESMDDTIQTGTLS